MRCDRTLVCLHRFETVKILARDFGVLSPVLIRGNGCRCLAFPHSITVPGGDARQSERGQV